MCFLRFYVLEQLKVADMDVKLQDSNKVFLISFNYKNRKSIASALALIPHDILNKNHSI